MIRYALCFLFGIAALVGAAQDDSTQTQVTITGKILDKDTELGIANLMVLNKRTGSGAFGNMDGSFSIKINRTDTLIIGGVGYYSQQLTFSDSADAASYNIKVWLVPQVYELEPFTVITDRDLEEIYADIEDLGYEESDYRVTGIDAYMSPITFLYQMFSKTERSKRLVHEMENEDRKRELLKELFSKYVKYDIIDLDDDEFDDFIDFVQVPEQFMKSASQYDFIIYIKAQYDIYTLYNR